MGEVEATDADRTEINSRISFLLQTGNGSSNFLIRSSYLGPGHYGGLLSMDPDTSLDYDMLQQKFFSLVVLAENTAAENVGDTANVSVVVHILDINDEPPTILPASLQDVNVSENGTQQGLVHTLVASDPDTNSSLVFEELAVACFKGASSAGEVCWDWFVLAPNGSVLANSSDIDYELCDRVVLTLRAEDLYTKKGNRYSQNGMAPTPRSFHCHRAWGEVGHLPLPPPRRSRGEQGSSWAVWRWREGVSSSFGPCYRDLSLLGGWDSQGKQRRVLQGCSVGDQSSAFGAFAETLRILITDVNDNTPLFLPILETFGELPGLVCPVGSSLHPHMLCHAPQQWGPSASQGRAVRGAGARLGLLDAFYEGCVAEGSGGMLGALLSPGIVWA